MRVCQGKMLKNIQLQCFLLMHDWGLIDYACQYERWTLIQAWSEPGMSSFCCIIACLINYEPSMSWTWPQKLNQLVVTMINHESSMSWTWLQTLNHLVVTTINHEPSMSWTWLKSVNHLVATMHDFPWLFSALNWKKNHTSGESFNY